VRIEEWVIFSRPCGTASCFKSYPGLASWVTFSQTCPTLALLLLRFAGHDDLGGTGLAGNEECATDSRPGGPAAKRQPSPEGLGDQFDEDPSAVGAALSTAPLPQPRFAVPGRGTSLSNKIN
jgi:hypothetical protein